MMKNMPGKLEVSLLRALLPAVATFLLAPAADATNFKINKEMALAFHLGT